METKKLRILEDFVLNNGVFDSDDYEEVLNSNLF